MTKQVVMKGGDTCMKGDGTMMKQVTMRGKGIR
jgi:hypothetical protein